MKIIIIGATSGIGKELALMYAAQGHLVGISGRRNNLLEEIKQLYPITIFTSCFDVIDSENSQHLQQLIVDLGGMDLLIYNSGFGDPCTDLIIETEMITTKTNVVGFVEIVAFAFNYFVQQGHGQIAVTSSVAALRGNSWAPAYSASKAFMSNYAEGLNIKAHRLKKDIIVTDIKPGFVKTKQAKSNRQFWVASTQKAAGQIAQAIKQKRRVAYITKRWWLVAQV
ncbi:MAG: SDR family NAD(P)-dependent oxidoreductase, partial [Bacteroidota bacterium]|nr:SDR family NAD(P)-dependent oxidoreductase [Bacteroidota bacterium]